ncbi:hypothetical protein [Psychrobacter sp. JB193]|uniref:hypothetical protein n=1 Tax=Psychrobacter sp. JB193 TaxID=2024406 RepID=UPI000BAABA21|nr:hypothetical protein [Psychrobacter sp. JB193]PAT63952.1 hypothetical protein CIK80_02240 [Psychrobacter sp. JB193]
MKVKLWKLVGFKTLVVSALLTAYFSLAFSKSPYIPFIFASGFCFALALVGLVTMRLDYKQKAQESQ